MDEEFKKKRGRPKGKADYKRAMLILNRDLYEDLRLLSRQTGNSYSSVARMAMQIGMTKLRDMMNRSRGGKLKMKEW